VLTEEGTEIRRWMRPVNARGMAEHFGRHLGDDEIRAVIGPLKRVIKAPRDAPV
jgi:hypothetical protein